VLAELRRTARKYKTEQPDFPVGLTQHQITVARQQETNQEQEPGAHPLVGETPEGGGGAWPRHWRGGVPARCPVVSSALGVCSGSPLPMQKQMQAQKRGGTSVLLAVVKITRKESLGSDQVC
jgi:hypothetical protein